MKSAVIKGTPMLRVTTDEGVDGFGQMEPGKAFLRGLLPVYVEQLVGQDPTDVERCMLRIRKLGGFKPWGGLVSALETALWDVAGKAQGVAVHKLLGGKVRDRVRVYHGGGEPVGGGIEGAAERYAAAVQAVKDAPEGFTVVKESVGYHGPMAQEFARLAYGEVREGPHWPNGGPVTKAALRHTVSCVAAMASVLGDEVALALDMGPGWTVADAITVLRELEGFGILWAEDLLTGDYVPWIHADQYREVTRSTTVPTHTGEQVYLRHNFRALIETQAVRVIGPDAADVGGIAELKWIAEYADLHGIQIAPHGVLNGLFGLAALVQVSATLPDNFLAFEYPRIRDRSWYGIVEGLPATVVEQGFVTVWDRPGMGIDFNREGAQECLSEQDADFFA